MRIKVGNSKSCGMALSIVCCGIIVHWSCGSKSCKVFRAVNLSQKHYISLYSSPEALRCIKGNAYQGKSGILEIGTKELAGSLDTNKVQTERLSSTWLKGTIPEKTQVYISCSEHCLWPISRQQNVIIRQLFWFTVPHNSRLWYNTFIHYWVSKNSLRLYKNWQRRFYYLKNKSLFLTLVVSQNNNLLLSQIIGIHETMQLYRSSCFYNSLCSGLSSVY